MPDVKVITDSLADIPPAIALELGITTVPCIVRFGTTEFRDRIDLFPDEFYRRLASSAALPATSQPAVGVFRETYERLAQETDQILSIHTLSSLSGIYNTSAIAAASIPNVRIRVIDSGQVTMTLGWLVILAARAACAGDPLENVARVVEDAKRRVHLVAMLDTLEYARRGGRLGRGAALLGTMLNVKPLLTVKNSEVVPVENVRSQTRALDRLVEIATAAGSIQEMSVIHAAAPRLAQVLRQKLARYFAADRIVMSEAGPVLGTHVGPGAVGIAWVTK